MKHTLQGNTDGVAGELQERLLSIYELAAPVGQLVTREIASLMLEVSEEIGREVAVYLTRQGKVAAVAIGDAGTVSLPEVKARSEIRLSGVRCIHTHPSGDTRLSDMDISSLRRLRFDMMAAIGIRGSETIYGSLAFLTGEESEDGAPYIFRSEEMTLQELVRISLTPLLRTVDKALARRYQKETADEVERVILAGIGEQTGSLSPEESLAELAELAKTAGAEVVATMLQKKAKPDAALFLGRGKVEELGIAIQNLDASLVIFDEELTPTQGRNLEQLLGCRVIDRTGLILDIFARRAKTREGKLQVELAQLQYRLPRIMRQGLVLSRLGGGIGTRGPGETKLEVDRRRIRSRIHELETALADVKRNRREQLKRRKKAGILQVALVGYTNAGKSTLLNALTGADVFVKDALFATLDPTTRQLALPSGRAVLLTDTVGFIRKLPHGLIAAFRGTLEETVEADLLLHVVDVSKESAEEDIIAVIEVLKELEATDKPMLYVLNKSDKLGEAGASAVARLLHGRPGVLVSARTGEGLESLCAAIDQAMARDEAKCTLHIPFADGAALDDLYSIAQVIATDYDAVGTRLTVRMKESDLSGWEKYRIDEKTDAS
ncbi:GTPase HflX [Selenomonas sp. TAMA-11512]|uniref:GTPase HflX n=1 Tax=Selenomonas sp. TAMA-11512 TaxID=3095337 RepID=UPI00308E391D|nr:GTPase HflX [Selenomonas sp. TAMA-11512]